MSDKDYRNVPTQLLDGAAESLAYGNTKYGEGKDRSNRSLNDRYNSLMGHLQDWKRGELTDPGSGLCHLKHASCQLGFLMAANETVESEVAEAVEYDTYWATNSGESWNCGT